VVEKQLEEGPLPRLQRDGSTVRGELAQERVEVPALREFPRRHRRRRRGSSSREGMQAGFEFVHGEGLREVVVGPEGESFDPVVDLVFRREKQDRGLDPRFANLPENLESADAGEHDIENDEIPLVLQGGGKTAFAIALDGHPKIGAAQAGQEMVRQFSYVLDEKQVQFHTRVHYQTITCASHPVSDDPDDPNDANWRNGEPDEIEAEWELLQTEFSKPGLGKGLLMAGAENLDNGDEVVTRRYEFFEYSGPFDEESGEAKAGRGGADRVHGEGVTLIGGVEVDLSTIEVVGAYRGAQMAAVIADASVGLIDHLADVNHSLVAQFEPAPQPDLTIGSTLAVQVGDGIYNNDATGQTIRQAATKKRKAVFYFKVENDSAAPDSITLTATRSDKRIGAAYFDLSNGRRNVTAALTKSLLPAELGASGGKSFMAVVAVHGKRVRRVKSFSIAARSAGDARDRAA